MTSSLYAQTGFPLFQNRTYGTATDAISCESGDIDLGQDAATGIVTNRAFDTARLIYDTDYNNDQSFSAPFRAHMDGVANLIEAHLGMRSLIEVGCGKGACLESMTARGAEISGFDPAYEGTNPLIQKAYFSPDMGMTGEGLILRHVLEHIPDPMNFLGQLAGANGGRGLIYIEVPCLDWILTNRAWFDIFYEHVNYFRLEDFQRMFGRVLVGERRFGGQYLSVIADLATLRRPEAGPPVAWPENFAVKLTAGKPGGMGLGRGVEGRNLFAAAPKGRIARRRRDRHKPREAGPLPARHRAGGYVARHGHGADARQCHDLCNEPQLSGRGQSNDRWPLHL